MRHSFLDKYSRLSSPVHRIRIAWKLTAMMVLLAMIIAVPISFVPIFIICFVFLMGIAWLSNIPAIFLFRRMALLELFVLGISILSLFQPNGIAVFSRLVVKSTLCLFTVVLFSNITPFTELLDFLKKMGVPLLLVTILALMYRYLFVLVDELERMQRARMSRTFVQSRMLVWRSLATVVSQLFIRSTGRAEKIFSAMCARGWQ
jgi:cobalt/nickel transport system permease protein